MGRSTIRIDFSEVTRFLRRLGKQGEAIAGQEMHAAMVMSGAQVHREAALRAPTDTGALRNSLATSAQGVGLGTVVEVGTPLEYGIPVELGVRPGEHPGLDDEGLKAVARWGRRKHGLDVHASWAMAKGYSDRLRARGAQAAPFLGPAVDASMGAIEGNFSVAVARTVQRMAAL